MATKHALIVDDSSTAQHRLKKMLKPYDLHIDLVDSGEAALRYLATNIPDVIFMDHLMPGMDGFRALQIIKSHPETAIIPVIMYTSKSGDLYTGQARALGALDVVSKDSINATDLSKVMNTIHIYRTEETDKSIQDKPTSDQGELNKNKKPNNVTDLTEHLIERRASSSTNVEQARNLELRLGHLEHTLEDSRRFITARVVRELQVLRTNIKQEISGALDQAVHTPHHVDPLPPTESNKGWTFAGKLLTLIALAMIAIFLSQMSKALSKTQQAQTQLSERINKIAEYPQPLSIAPSSVETPAAKAPETTAAKIVASAKPGDNTYLADIAWAFNQTGQLPFNQNHIDSKSVIRLYELLNRIITNGFHGKVWVNIYVGNFCIVVDNAGLEQLPTETVTMSNCVLSSDIYGLDRVMDQYEEEVETALNGLDQKKDKPITVIINTVANPDDYPERKSTLSARNWNIIAQDHNRLELRLEPKTP
jgi:CheY-like chemotaxis protein